jgi:predicted DNA-binding transcriptional regulator YafY
MSHQVRRSLRIVSLLSAGRALTTTEIAERIAELEPDKHVTIRQIQRDLRTISESGIALHEERDGAAIRWSLPRNAAVLSPLPIDGSEILSIHMLKGALSAFKGTRVERDVEALRRKLERIAPGRIFLEKDIVAEYTPGRFATAVNDDAMEKIVNAIVDPHWDRVTYRSVDASEPRTFVVSFCRLVNHAGRLYVAAWHPRYEHYITLAADRIDHVERANDVTDPIHVFREERYRSGRFGVYDGTVATVRLRIDAAAASFFMNREWHPTQRFTVRRNGDVDMTMEVPLSPELISWVVSWADVLRIVGPKKLRDECRRKVASLV